jgi:hypothetical protein
MKIKVKTGFLEEQYFVIEASEAHKAYYAFSNPDSRVIFENGIAIIGRNIVAIEPAWVEIMHWNRGYKMTAEDWACIPQEIQKKVSDCLSTARDVAVLAEKKKELLSLPLKEAKNALLLLSDKAIK